MSQQQRVPVWVVVVVAIVVFVLIDVVLLWIAFANPPVIE